MAKKKATKKKPKARILYIRNLQKETGKLLDEFKSKHEIKTDSKAIVKMIFEYSELLKKIERDNHVIDQLQEDNTDMNDVLRADLKAKQLFANYFGLEYDYEVPHLADPEE